jgi:hypothetical protein
MTYDNLNRRAYFKHTIAETYLRVVAQLGRIIPMVNDV